MKFQQYSASKPAHTGFASCVCWLSNELVVTCGDDRKLLFWNSTAQHDPIRSLSLPMEGFPTSMHSMNRISGAGAVSSIDTSFSNFNNAKQETQSTNQLLALGTSNGHFYLVPYNWNGNRIDKSFEAHSGSVIIIRWSNDNTTLATGGEDGLIKIWSRIGMLRSTITSNSIAKYALSWSTDSNSLAYGNANHLVVKSLSPHSKLTEWQAHDGLIVSVHWNLINGLILTASEDTRVKIWDSTGKALFISAPNSTIPTSVAWSNDGDLFAISTFNSLKLHDLTGTCLSVEKLSSEGAHAIAWSPDSNQLCCVCATGQVIFMYVIEKCFESDVWQAENTSRRTIKVTNCTNDVSEVFEFRDPISRISFAYDHLLVVTVSQCFIYQTSNWTTPYSFDVKNIDVCMIRQSQKHFLLMTAKGANLYTYDGRFIRTLKLPNLGLDGVRPHLVSINNNTLAYKDAINSHMIQFIELNSQQNFAQKERNGSSYHHFLEIIALKISPESCKNEQVCALLDKNFDLYIVAVSGRDQLVNSNNLQAFKLSSMINDFIWHSDSCVLVSLHDNRTLSVWLFPSIAFIDSSLLPEAVLGINNADLSPHTRIIDFSQNKIIARRPDNVRVHIALNPFVILLHKLRNSSRWQEAVKMCNFLDKSMYESTETAIDRNICNVLWATLAAMALDAKEFPIAEIAYAAINKLDKVLYLNRIKTLPIAEVSTAESELLCGNIAAAEQDFIQKGFILRAVMLNLELFRWKRALELAQRYNAKFPEIIIEQDLNKQKMTESIDIDDDSPAENNKRSVDLIHLVLAFRQNYLNIRRKSENFKEFQTLMNEVNYRPVEWTGLEKAFKNDNKLIYLKNE